MAAPAGTEGLIRSTVRVRICDISGGGIQFQASSPVRPGSIYALQVNLGGFALSTQIRITRCRAGGFIKDGRGGQMLLFQAGAELVFTSPEASKRLHEWLDGRKSLEREGIEADLTGGTPGPF